jgi:hypothetical protein
VWDVAAGCGKGGRASADGAAHPEQDTAHRGSSRDDVVCCGGGRSCAADVTVDASRGACVDTGHLRLYHVSRARGVQGVRADQGNADAVADDIHGGPGGGVTLVLCNSVARELVADPLVATRAHQEWLFVCV